MNPPTKKTKKGYGPFLMAATLYTIGVLLFATWSYLQQRSTLLKQIDQSLIHATYATEQILGSIFIECAVEADSIYGLGYVANQKNLDHFASNCHFEYLGAFGYKQGTSWKLIIGNQESLSGATSSNSLNSIPSTISSTIQRLARSEKETTHMQTITTGTHEELRIATRYHSIGGDRGYAILVAQNTQDAKQSIQRLALRMVAIALFLHVMAFPLILLYSRIHKKTAEKMTAINLQLKQDFIQQKEREAELEDAIQDLERFNAMAVGREDRIIELKSEVNTLLKQMKREKRYNVE